MRARLPLTRFYRRCRWLCHPNLSSVLNLARTSLVTSDDERNLVSFADIMKTVEDTSNDLRETSLVATVGQGLCS